MADKEKKITLVSVIKDVGAKGATSRKDLAQKVFDTCQKKGITKNSRNVEIKLERVLSLINSFIRDIKTERKGHWQSMKVVENDKELKILPKL